MERDRLLGSRQENYLNEIKDKDFATSTKQDTAITKQDATITAIGNISGGGSSAPIRPADKWPINHTNANSARKSCLAVSPGANLSWYITGYVLTGGSIADGFSILRRNCVKFNGATDTFTVADTTSLEPTTADSAFEFTIKADADAVSITNFLAKWDGTNGYKLSLTSEGTLQFTVSDGTNSVTITSKNSINDGIWHHIVINIDTGSATGLQMFIDNVSAHESAGDLSLVGSITGTTANFIITGGASKTFCMGVFGFYRQQILSASEIETRYANGAGSKFTGTETGLLLGWNFDDGVGATVKDVKIQSSGTLANTAWVLGEGTPIDPHTLPNTITYLTGTVYQATAVGVMNIPTTCVQFPHPIKIGRNNPIWISETDGSFGLQLFGYPDTYEDEE